MSCFGFVCCFCLLLLGKYREVRVTADVTHFWKTFGVFWGICTFELVILVILGNFSSRKLSSLVLASLIPGTRFFADLKDIEDFFINIE